MAKLLFGDIKEEIITRDEFSLDHAQHVLANETVAVLGYGVQGPAQALNLKDSGINVIIGNPDDDYAKQAKHEGFEVKAQADAAREADVVMMLIPDEVMPEVFEKDIKLVITWISMSTGKLLGNYVPA